MEKLTIGAININISHFRFIVKKEPVDDCGSGIQEHERRQVKEEASAICCIKPE